MVQAQPHPPHRPDVWSRLSHQQMVQLLLLLPYPPLNQGRQLSLQQRTRLSYCSQVLSLSSIDLRQSLFDWALRLFLWPSCYQERLPLIGCALWHPQLVIENASSHSTSASLLLVQSPSRYLNWALVGHWPPGLDLGSARTWFWIWSRSFVFHCSSCRRLQPYLLSSTSLSHCWPQQQGRPCNIVHSSGLSATCASPKVPFVLQLTCFSLCSGYQSLMIWNASWACWLFPSALRG